MKATCGKIKRRLIGTGFTLLEILVALTVLSVVLVLAAQMVGSVSASWKMGVARADSAAQARVVLGMIERDIRNMVLRDDLPAFVDADGEPACAFYAARPGAGGTRDLSLVRYSVPDSPASPRLMREDLAYLFPSGTSTSGPLYGEFGRLGALPQATSQMLSESVLALQVQFLDANGQLSDVFRSASSGTAQSVVAVVSLLLLDDAAYRLAEHNGSLAGLVASAVVAPNAGETHGAAWNRRIEAGLPGAGAADGVRAGIRSFERRIPLPVRRSF